MERIAIIGGGYAGVAAAKKLAKKFKRNKEIEIILIDKNPYHTLMTELHEVAGARVAPEAVKVHFDKIFAASKVKFVRDLVESVNFKSHEIIGSKESYAYDYLIIGTGAEPTYFNLPGIEEHAFPLWAYDDAMDIREHTDKMFRKALAERDPVKKQELLTFVVAGAGFTGMEMAGELMERKRKLCRRYGINKDEVNIIIVEAMADVLPMLPPKDRQVAIKYYKKKNIEIKVNSRCTKATANSLELHTGEIIPTQTIIWTCGIQGTDFADALDIESRHVRRPQPNKYLQSEKYPSVYFAGDMIWFMEDEKPLPQIVETAMQTGETSAKNIIASITGKELEEHKSNYHGVMVSLGSKYGVSHTNGFSMRGFMAIALKHFVNFHYLFSICGLNAVWGYLKHEFLDVEDKRSVSGGHLSAKIPLYWALPLRIFIGTKWLVEGIKKIKEGWLSPGPGGLSNIDPTAIKIPGVSFSDAVAAASDSGWAEEGVEAVEQTAVYVKPLLEEPLKIYTWFADNIIAISPTVAFLFQSLLVIMEIGIGLAILGGTFTFLAAVASLGLSLMFIVSGMAGSEIIWYIFGAFVLMGGAGKAFGLDYWIMPRIKRWWNSRKFAKKTFLYIGYPSFKKMKKTKKKK